MKGVADLFFRKFFGFNKRGMEAGVIGKLVIAIVVLVLLVFGAWALLGGKGGDILEAIKNAMRFGK